MFRPVNLWQGKNVLTVGSNENHCFVVYVKGCETSSVNIVSKLMVERLCSDRLICGMGRMFILWAQMKTTALLFTLKGARLAQST